MAENKYIKCEGILNKWANYAKGYRRRWFVLECDVLSYYKSKEDYPVRPRGSLSLKNARLILDPSDRYHFIILCTSSSAIRYHLKADNIINVKKWLIALQQAIHLDNIHSVPNISKTSMKELDASLSQLSMTESNKDSLNNIINDFTGNEFDEDKGSVRLTNEMSFVSSPSTFNQKEINKEVEDIDQVSDGQSDDEFFDASPSWNAQRNRGSFLDHPRKISSSMGSRGEDDPSQVIKSADDEKLTAETDQTLLSPLEFLSKEDNDQSHDIKKSSSQVSLPTIVFVPPPPSDAGLDFLKMSLLGYPENPRNLLPVPMCVDASTVSLWTILKSAINLDLTRITVPIHFNEPISMLQRLAEDVEYSSLLDTANSLDLSIERIMFVASFAASNYSSTEFRVGKPFNPLLGETFELVDKKRGFRYISEQVSHHPPVSACHCDSVNYTFWSEVDVHTRFGGKYIELRPLGYNHVILKRTGEHFSWKKVTTVVNNIIFGKLWIDHYGEMKIINHSTGETCVLDFKATGWRGGNAKKIEGKAFDINGQHVYDIFGHWNDSLIAKKTTKHHLGKTFKNIRNTSDGVYDGELSSAVNSSTSTLSNGQVDGDRSDPRLNGPRSDFSDVNSNSPSNSFSSNSKLASAAQSLSSLAGLPDDITLWHVRPRFPESSTMYNFTSFTLILNELAPSLEERIPPTDSRLRPDQRAMENGDIDAGVKLKDKLEMKQRATRKKNESATKASLKASNKPAPDNLETLYHSPRWFVHDVEKDTNDSQWVYKGGYWEAKESANWGDVPQIFINGSEPSSSAETAFASDATEAEE